MTWTKISDDWPDRPALLEVSRSARLLLLEAMVYCNRQGTDGTILRTALRRTTDAEPLDEVVAELQAAGLFAPTPDGRGWTIDWSDQEKADQVKARQANRAKIQALYRERRDRHGRGDHSICDPRNCRQKPGHVTGNATGNKPGHETPSRPVPPRPGGAGGREPGRGAGKAAGRRCVHGRPIAVDGAGCAECADPPTALGEAS